MIAILRAYGRALRSMVVPGMLRHFLWPVLASAVLWLGAGLALWGRLTRVLIGLFQHWPVFETRLSSGSGAELALSTSIHLALYLLSVPLMVVTSVFILELVALPIILDKVAASDYAHVERRSGGSQWQSLRNTVVSFLVAAAIAVATLPLWLIPGVGVAVSLVLSAWLNDRSFRYDVLMKHADAQELQTLPRAHRGRLFCMALVAGMLSLVPPVNLLVVPFVGLSFAHYLLHALHESRRCGLGP
jgi:uncharacterized protein involved in cysteine biosynthesis